MMFKIISVIFIVLFVIVMLLLLIRFLYLLYKGHKVIDIIFGDDDYNNEFYDIEDNK